ncbi:MAG TPA: type II secretion system F family protein [Candidatus Paceibacterota bacterium]
MNKLSLKKYFKYVSLYLASGRTADESFGLSLARISDKKFRAGFSDFIASMREGVSVDASLDRLLDSRIIDSTIYSLILLGYKTGNLKEYVRQACSYIEKSQSFKKRLVGALAYPAVVLAASMGSVTYIANVVLPKVVPVFESLKAPVPAITRLLLEGINLISAYGLGAFASVAGLCSALFIAYTRSTELNLFVHRNVYNIPFLGRLVALSHVHGISLGIGTLLAAQVAISDAFEVAAHSSSNSHVKEGLSLIRSHFEEGKPFSELDLKSNVFDREICDSLALGESTGTMPQAFLDLSEFSRQEYEDVLGSVSALVEPAALVVSALLVGIVALSVISPMYSLVQHVN